MGKQSRRESRITYGDVVRLGLLEDDADSHEAEVAGLKQSIQRLTWTIAGATGTLMVGVLLWALEVIPTVRV